MPSWNRSAVAATVTLVLALPFLPTDAGGQEPDPGLEAIDSQVPKPEGAEAPSSYVEEMTEPRNVGGVEDEADAEAAEAAEAEAAGAEAAGLSPEEAKKVEQIVVSARRRQELLEETPISITALSEETLRATGTTQLDQIQYLVPNLSIFRTGNGQTASIVLRGVGNFPFVYYDQGTGLYIDGVYLSRNQGSLLDMVDIQQLEVLRGPQGTLFGKNTLGGAINITTVKPREELEAFAMIRAGGYGTLDTRATLNLPVDIGWFEDKLFTRFTFASFNMDGYAYNSLRDEYQSNRNSQNFLGAVRLLPTDDVTIDVTGTYATSHAYGLGGQCVVIPQAFEDALAPLVAAGLVPAGYAEQYRQSCESSQPFNFQSEAARLASIDSYGVWGTAAWDAGEVGWLEALDFKLTSAWRQQTPRVRDDFDLTSMPVSVLSTAGGGDPFDGTQDWQNQIQLEAQVNGTAWDDRINFVAGAFWFWEKARTDNGFRFFAPTEQFQISPIVVNAGFSQNFISTDNNDWALFGQGTVDITDWFSLTAGVRYTEETKRLDRLLLEPCSDGAPPGSPACSVPSADPVTVDFEGEQKSSAWTPTVTAAFPVPEEWIDPWSINYLMGYFTYSQGFRGGGFNGGARTPAPIALEPFKPEFIDSYEIGAKSIVFDNRATINVSFFLADRFDQQGPEIVVTEAEPIDQVDVLTRNAAESNTRGVELEVNTQPIDDMLIDASMGYVDAKFGGYSGAQNAVTGEPIDRAGQQLPFIPKWQTHLGIQYSMEMPRFGPDWLQGWLTPRLDWSFQGATQYWAPELPQLLQPYYNLLSLRLSYDFMDNTSQIAFWGSNVANATYFQESVAIPRVIGVVTRYYEQPRTFGIEISHRF
ncbi:MAG: TonB-dependent receptor [Deltaproteobacteria bacterium]|nr:TonB-dependent receptor [Deltaproteobacteria bacterium]